MTPGPCQLATSQCSCVRLHAVKMMLAGTGIGLRWEQAARNHMKGGSTKEDCSIGMCNIGQPPDTQGPWSAQSMTHMSMNRVAYFGNERLNHSSEMTSPTP